MKLDDFRCDSDRRVFDIRCGACRANVERFINDAARVADTTQRFLERTKQRWVDAGAPLTAFTEIDARIADLQKIMR